MSKIVLVDKPKNQLTKFPGEPPPPARIVPLSDFDDFRRDIARCGSICKDLNDTEKEITSELKYMYHFNPEGEFAGLLRQANDLLARFERQAPERERLNKEIEAFNPEDDPDCDEHGPSRRHVAKQVGLLLGAFPAGSPADPAVYTSMMIEEVLAAGHSKIALESAVRTARRTLKFLPTISEVLSILKAEEEKWDDQYNDFYCDIEAGALKEAVTAAQAKIAELEKEKEIKAAKKAQAEIAGHSFVVGDRVQHDKLGAGNVIGIEGDICTVKFDSKDEPRKVVRTFLEHHAVFDGSFADQDDPKNAF